MCSSLTVQTNVKLVPCGNSGPNSHGIFPGCLHHGSSSFLSLGLIVSTACGYHHMSVATQAHMDAYTHGHTRRINSHITCNKLQRPETEQNFTYTWGRRQMDDLKHDNLDECVFVRSAIWHQTCAAATDQLTCSNPNQTVAGDAGGADGALDSSSQTTYFLIKLAGIVTKLTVKSC